MKTINIKSIAKIIRKSDSEKDVERAENLAGKYLRGINKPSYENIILLEKKLSIPFLAWKDIKSYVESVTDSKNKSEHHKEGKVL